MFAVVFGMVGVASGQLIAYAIGTGFLIWYLASGRSPLTLNLSTFTLRKNMFADILKVGAISCLSPVQTVLTIVVFTKIITGFGPRLKT